MTGLENNIVIWALSLVTSQKYDVWGADTRSISQIRVQTRHKDLQKNWVISFMFMRLWKSWNRA